MFEKINTFLSTNLVRLNKKETKVVLTVKARVFGWVARLIEFGIPLSYIAYKYGLFSTEDKPYSVTGGTFFGVIVVYALFQNSINSWVRQFNEESSDTLKRAKWVGVWLFAGLFVWIGSIFLQALLLLFVVSGVGVGASLIFWKPYDVAIADKKELENILEEQVNVNKLEALKTIQLNKKEKATL